MKYMDEVYHKETVTDIKEWKNYKKTALINVWVKNDKLGSAHSNKFLYTMIDITLNKSYTLD